MAPADFPVVSILPFIIDLEGFCEYHASNYEGERKNSYIYFNF